MVTSITTRRGTLIEVMNLGNFQLDGGTMFGRVPRVMWEKWFPPDTLNRITMATNVMRLVKEGLVYVIDAGLGTRYPPREWEILGTGPHEISVITEGVDRVVFTHLHWDHCGAIGEMTVRGEVFVSRAEWEDAHGVNPLSKGSYRALDLDAMADRVRLVEGPCEIAPGLEIIPTPGHTQGHMSVLVDDEVFYPGDLIPTASHVHLPCIMAYDLLPLTVLETKKNVLERAVARDWTLVFEHDPYRPVARVAHDSGRFKAV